MHPPPLTSTHSQPPKIMSHPEELPIHPHPTPHTQNNPHPPPRTQHKPQLLKIMPRHHHSHKIWSNTTHLLKLLFDQDVTYGRHIIKVNFNFHGHIYTFTKCMIVCVPYLQCVSSWSTYPRAKRRDNFSFWRANVTKDVPNFQTFLLQMLREISIFYYYIKNSTLYLLS